MSRNPTPSSKSTPTTKTYATDAEELARLDAAFTRINAAVPEAPYTLSVPINVEPRYHYPSRQEAESWARNTPFYPHEERVQYMTYVLREAGDGIFVVRSKVDEEREARSKQGHLRNGSLEEAASTTRPGTPLAIGYKDKVEKKKISLSDYKEKVAGGKGDKREDKDVAVVGKKKPEEKKLVNGVKSEIKMASKAAKKEQVLTPGTKRFVICLGLFEDVLTDF
jgi:hypothetical protein